MNKCTSKTGHEFQLCSIIKHVHIINIRIINTMKCKHCGVSYVIKFSENERVDHHANMDIH